MSYSPQEFGDFSPIECGMSISPGKVEYQATFSKLVQMACSPMAISLPQFSAVELPARHAYSHWASRGSENLYPMGNFPLNNMFRMKHAFIASSQDTCQAACSGLATSVSSGAVPSESSPRKKEYCFLVISYWPIQKSFSSLTTRGVSRKMEYSSSASSFICLDKGFKLDA